MMRSAVDSLTIKSSSIIEITAGFDTMVLSFGCFESCPFRPTEQGGEIMCGAVSAAKKDRQIYFGLDAITSYQELEERRPSSSGPRTTSRRASSSDCDDEPSR